MLKRTLAAFVLCFAVGAASFAEDVAVGTYPEFPPFEFLDAGRALVGFDIDILEAIGRESGFVPKWNQQSFVSLIQGLEEGFVDLVASGLTITESRRQRIDFSDSYFEVSLVVVVRKGSPAPQSLEELKNTKMSILLGSTANMVVEDAFGAAPANVRLLAKYSDIFADLETGRADAVLVDEPMARHYSLQFDDLVPGTVKMHVEEYGFAVRKGDDKLLGRVNDGLAKIRASGEFDRIREKWFKEE